MTLSLAGRTIALAEGRQLEDLAQMLEKEGAAIVRCPMVSILDAPDPAPVVAWLRELIADRFDILVLLTGEGLRRLLRCAEGAGLRNDAIAAISRTAIITRGPKPGRALSEIGLKPTSVAPHPTTEGVIAALREQALHGKTVGVQLYSESNPPLLEFLQTTGANARTVLPYVYAPSSDADHVARLLDEMASGRIDVLVFTSSPQVDRLYEVAKERGIEEKLRQGMARTRIAAVGPVVADNLRGRHARVDICPEQGFVMKNLVQHIKRAFQPD
jgi:uroporphyrinogen-III synthase